MCIKKILLLTYLRWGHCRHCRFIAHCNIHELLALFISRFKNVKLLQQERLAFFPNFVLYHHKLKKEVVR